MSVRKEHSESDRVQIEIANENDAKSIWELQKLAFYQRGLDYNNMNLTHWSKLLMVTHFLSTSL